jgi:hypothetical protein
MFLIEEFCLVRLKSLAENMLRAICKCILPNKSEYVKEEWAENTI